MTANPNLPLTLFFRDYLEDYAADYAAHHARYAAEYALKTHAPPLIPLVYKALSL